MGQAEGVSELGTVGDPEKDPPREALGGLEAVTVGEAVRWLLGVPVRHPVALAQKVEVTLLDAEALGLTEASCEGESVPQTEGEGVPEPLMLWLPRALCDCELLPEAVED